MRWLILLSLAIVSCGPAIKLKRAEKLIAEAGELGAKWKSDTVKTTIEVVRPEIRIQTVTKILPGDTIIREKDRIIQKIIRLPGDSIIVETFVPADTIRKEVPVYITRTISAGYTKWELIGTVIGENLFLLLIAFGVYKILKLKRE